MKNNKDLAILVLSCDKYSDLWDDFFNLKEQHWPDCPYPTYVATDSVQYERPGVQVIHFGNIRTWTVCARKAIEKIDSHYIALFLEDAFIYKKIDSSIIEVDVQIMKEKGIDFLTLERDRTNKHTPNETPIAPHIWKIDKHQEYGIDTSAAIWEKSFLLHELAKADLDAWMFEVSKNKEAATERGLEGNIYFDDRLPFNISPIEIVREGKITPNSIRFFKKLGYTINTSRRPVMSEFKLLWYKLKCFVVTHRSIYGLARILAKTFGIKTYNNA